MIAKHLYGEAPRSKCIIVIDLFYRFKGSYDRDYLLGVDLLVELKSHKSSFLPHHWSHIYSKLPSFASKDAK